MCEDMLASASSQVQLQVFAKSSSRSGQRSNGWLFIWRTCCYCERHGVALLDGCSDSVFSKKSGSHQYLEVRAHVSRFIGTVSLTMCLPIHKRKWGQWDLSFTNSHFILATRPWTWTLAWWFFWVPVNKALNSIESYPKVHNTPSVNLTLLQARGTSLVPTSIATHVSSPYPFLCPYI